MCEIEEEMKRSQSVRLTCMNSKMDFEDGRWTVWTEKDGEFIKIISTENLGVALMCLTGRAVAL